MSAVDEEVDALMERLHAQPAAVRLRQIMEETWAQIADAEAQHATCREISERAARRYGSLTAHLAKANKPRPGKRVLR